MLIVRTFYQIGSKKNDAGFLKLFTDDTSFFSYKVKDCAYTWRMYFNPDFQGYVQMRITLRKKCLYSELFWSRVILFTQCHPFIYFYNIPVTQTNVQKHIWLYLDEKLNCNTHVK